MKGEVQATLWDLIERAPAVPAPSKTVVRQRKAPAKAAVRGAAKYEHIVRDQLKLHSIRVRKWRRSMSGIAWYVTYRDGHVQRLIEAPRPKTPLSLAIFLHEVGHHAIGFDTYKPRCLEEYHAWRYALTTMAELGVEATEPVTSRYERSMRYAVAKAARRGIKRLPEELIGFVGPGM
jgi:hypothetical protein